MSYEDGKHLFQQKTSTNYAYGVTVEQMTRILDKDDAEDKWEGTLCYKLGQLEGVRNVDYDGHFGPFIYYTIDAEHDGSKTSSDIFDLIWEAYQ